jgi:hypothetical protein
MSGRSSENRIVNFILANDQRRDNDEPHDTDLVGQLVNVVIEKACANSLWGRSAPDRGLTDALQIKGGETNAA